MTKYFNAHHAAGAIFFTLIFTFLGSLDPVSAAILTSWGYIFRELAHQSNRLLKHKPVFYVKAFFDALSPTIASALTVYIILWVTL